MDQCKNGGMVPPHQFLPINSPDFLLTDYNERSVEPHQTRCEKG